MRYPMMILAGAVTGGLLAYGLVEHDKIADLIPMPDAFLPRGAALVIEKMPVDTLLAPHKVHLSTLPMRDGVWGIEKKIAAGEE